MVPDMLQGLKNVGMPESDFQALFSSAEAYVQMWEKTGQVAISPTANVNPSQLRFAHRPTIFVR